MDNIRPQKFEDYIGQVQCKKNLQIFIEASKIRGKCLDHVLLYGPPGLGKTTLANIIANELGAKIKTISGPSIEKIGDLLSVITSLNYGDVLFIDEIHRVPNFIEEVLYSILEDFFVEVVVPSSDGGSRVLKIDVEPFTLIGATTKIGNLSAPLRDRFLISLKLNLYSITELSEIIKRSAKILNLNINNKEAEKIAQFSRQTPRIANKYLKRIGDYALVKHSNNIDINLIKLVMKNMNVDEEGLNEIDFRYLKVLYKYFNNRFVGINNIAKHLDEDIRTIEEIIEPFLIKKEFIKITKKGRIILEKGINYVKNI